MSIKLHNIVRSAISSVNSDVSGTVLASNGYTIAANGKQTPGYLRADNVTIQEQPLDAGEIKHLDSLNIQGIMRGFWLDGNIDGVNRPLGTGGDWIIVPSGAYKIVHVFEAWNGPGWCHVAGALQQSANVPVVP